jgi:hypothetical protein
MGCGVGDPPNAKTIKKKKKKIKKFPEIFASKGAPQVSMTPVANLLPVFASVVDTVGKFSTGVYDTGGKFATGINDTGGNLPPVSKTPAANGNNISGC